MKGSWQKQMCAQKNQVTIDSQTLDSWNKRSSKIPRKGFLITVVIVMIKM